MDSSTGVWDGQEPEMRQEPGMVQEPRRGRGLGGYKSMRAGVGGNNSTWDWAEAWEETCTW